MTDLRNEVDENYYFGEVKIWNDSARQNEFGVLVESKINEITFRKIFPNKGRFFSVEGWENVDKVLSLVESEKYDIKGVIGIIDADFRRITNNFLTHRNIFMTDGHDTEIMTVNSQAWDELVSFYKDETKLEEFESTKMVSLKVFLFNLAKPISCLRLINEEKKLELKFKFKSKDKYIFMDYSNFVSSNLEFNLSNFLKEVENKSQKQGFFKNNSTLIKDLNEYIAKEFDLINLTNGHDLINLFSISLISAISNRKSGNKVSSIDLEHDLIKNYRFSDFQLTSLYSNLLDWQNNNLPYRFF